MQAGFKDEERDANVTGRAPLEIAVPLSVLRGSIFIDTAAPAAIKVNGTPLTVSAPVELALLPGQHVIAVELGSLSREQAIMVKPGARLKITVKP